MKEVKINNKKGYAEAIILVSDNSISLRCPFNRDRNCNRICAWFDIEVRGRDKITDFAKIEVITCKGIPIAKLVEEN